MSEDNRKVEELQINKQNNITKWVEVLQNLYEKQDDYSDEKEDLYKIITKIEDYLKQRYIIIEPFAVGGTGLLFLIQDKYSNKFRALKISRPLPKKHKSASLIKEEGDKLTRLVHPNIIEVHEVDTFEYSEGNEVAYFIMDYVKDAMDLKKKILFEMFQNKISIDDTKKYTPKISAKNALEKLFLFFHGLASGLEFMHNYDDSMHDYGNYIHFDIKPENVLIDDAGISRVTDLGYAKEKIENSDVEITIGFTDSYAHPDLFKYNFEKTRDPNRLRAPIIQSEFKYEWDIYALGQSILELLKLIDEIYPNDAIHLSSFRYLHLLACRMLDGRNNQKQNQKFFDEMASGLSINTFEQIRYEKMSDIRKDLEKEIGVSSLAKLVPELNFLSRKTLQGAETRPTTFTPRLKILVEHPLFSRLSHISQLGMIRYVYPTVSHTRYDHSIGTYTNACAYVIALYNDSENPLFRQLVNEEDIKAVLLASLLHDLGQYPLAHDCEEIDSDIFGHTTFSINLLEQSNIVDIEKRTIKQIIEDKTSGWGVPISRISDIIIAKPLKHRDQLPPSFKTRLLSTIIDGPIDADKIDYLLRDSRECRINYGKVIDFERLMKTITVAHDFDTTFSADNVSLAIYDKGKACAESIAFARYLLFSAVYWHHTSRASKAMIHHALRLMLQLYGRGKKSKEKLKKDFFNFVISLESGQHSENSLISHLKEEDYRTLIYRSDLECLDWFYRRSPANAQNLFYDLAERRLYKRLASIQMPSNNPEESLWGKFQNLNLSDDVKCIEFCEKLQEKILFDVRRKKNKYNITTISLSDNIFDKFEQLMSKDHISILIDIPNYKDYIGSKNPLRFIPETMEKRYLDYLPEDFIVQESSVWSNHIKDLMKSLSVVRIFCHPDVRQTIKAALSVQDIIEIAQECK